MTDDDLARLAADDDLLDRIGRGDVIEDAPDPIALLAEWRAALPDRPGSITFEGSPEPSYRPHVGTLDPLPSHDIAAPAETTAFLEPAVAPETTATKAAPKPAAATTAMKATEAAPKAAHLPKSPSAKPRTTGRAVRWLAAAAAVIAAGVGVVTLTGNQPDGPSAPTYPAGPNRVAVAAAEQVLGEARVSIERHDLHSARALLDRVATLIDDVRDPAEERRLRAELDRLRALAVEPSPTATSSSKVTTRPAQVLPTTTVVPVTAGGPAKPPQVTTTTPSVRTRPGLPTLLPSVIPTFR